MKKPQDTNQNYYDIWLTKNFLEMF